ncbi:putative strictosidine synthase transcription factor WD40-like family [Helianthus annuus]|uniref:Strictosidine synthase n=2 Tax=Helianthus annuus TaxID=4232 RepID=A0A251SU83_HELAN|nr:putative strictosidine synthase [Helianthus annuus]KAJ0477636.1 putative strictosidine synthase transcription factor WD40-like family [Helianthus annuus]KAJ0482160.1 putative strictosidine synthase transcription factor WD40-like family [Helianthus annuus]KAJ0498467.1 putative strictosidine synthase transcription factor WD40-like family [Helianthus annuus]KAJ0664483.1 putative strictosidine synthase transcription factor WD40-like family [Helianthus annuus]
MHSRCVCFSFYIRRRCITKNAYCKRQIKKSVFTYNNITMKTISLLVVKLIVWFLLLGSVLSNDYKTFKKLVLPPSVTGPESAAFDRAGEGPYVTVADGRILKWKGPAIGFVDFAYISPNRTKKLCDGTNDLELGPTCGRPVALSFNYKTSDLYITDAFFGLLVVGFNGGLATQLSGGYKYLSGIDVESYTGNVYMTDASLTADSTGKLLKYDPRTQRVTVLMSGLAGAGGPAVSSDRKYVLVPDFVNKKIQRYWLQGPKRGTNEVFMTNFGSPKNIKRAVNDGEFWVAVEKQAQGLRINGSAMVLQTVPLTQFSDTTVGVVQEMNDALYVGSSQTDFVGVYTN